METEIVTFLLGFAFCLGRYANRLDIVETKVKELWHWKETSSQQNHSAKKVVVDESQK